MSTVGLPASAAPGWAELLPSPLLRLRAIPTTCRWRTVARSAPATASRLRWLLIHATRRSSRSSWSLLRPPRSLRARTLPDRDACGRRGGNAPCCTSSPVRRPQDPSGSRPRPSPCPWSSTRTRRPLPARHSESCQFPGCSEPRNQGEASALWSATPQPSIPCESSAAESIHARHAPAHRPQLCVPSSGDGWVAFADTVPIPRGWIENPAPLRGPHLVFCHVIAGTWNMRLTIPFDQDGVAGKSPPLLSNTPFLRVCLGGAAIRRAGAPHADDVVASLAAHLFHVGKCPISERATHA